MNQITSNRPSAGTELTSTAPVFTPPADILEKGDTVVMLLDVPGADPASLDVTLDKRILTIAARGRRMRRRAMRRPTSSSRRHL